MRAPRNVRVRDLSDSQLETELIEAYVVWMVSPGVPLPPPRLERLLEAYNARFRWHSPRCACEECFIGYPVDQVDEDGF
jgi:hypothetical protein